jgi:hypothetical protein
MYTFSGSLIDDYRREMTLGKTNPQKDALNANFDCWTPEYTASRAYRTHIVASDHKMKDPHVHTTSTTVPVEV